MLRILKLTTYNCTCGIATYSHNLVSGLSANKCEVDVHLLPERKDLLHHTDEQFTVLLDQFINKAIRLKYDAVHIQHEYGLFMGGDEMSDSIIRFGYLLRKLNEVKLKTVVTFHTGPEIFYEDSNMWRFVKRDWSFIVDRLLTRIWNREVVPWFQPEHDCTAIVHVDITRTNMINSGLHPDQVIVIPHGVLNRRLEFKPIDKRDTINMSIFGFISSYKGYHTAIQALQLLPVNYTLTCMGGRHPNSEGSEYSDILTFAAELDHSMYEHGLQKLYNSVTDRVRITGFLSDEQADAEHEKTQLCLVPYETKNFSGSGALTWSITSGKPVIASNIPAFVDINNEHACMHLFNKADHHELAWSIKHIVEREDKQETLVDAANKYTQECSWSNVAKTHINLYK